MSITTDVHDAIQNPTKPGPKTPEGKAASSRNALKEGLFTTRDFIRLGERDEYDNLAAAFRGQLAPEGPLEEVFTTEIIGANWRLRRCRLVEEDLSNKYDEIDPLQDDDGSKVQRSVDRARANAHNVIRRAMAEMRKLQTERHIRTGLDVTGNYGIADLTRIVSALAKYGPKPTEEPEAPKNYDEVDPFTLDLNDPEQFAAFDRFIMTTPLANKNYVADELAKYEARKAGPRPASPETDSFCKADPRSASPASQLDKKVGRNDKCPCGSGLKYKKCCNSPEVHNQKHAA